MDDGPSVHPIIQVILFGEYQLTCKLDERFPPPDCFQAPNIKNSVRAVELFKFSGYVTIWWI